MTSLAKWTIVAVCLTVLAVLVPWAHYGGFDIELSRLPWWWAYLGAAVVMHGFALLPVRIAAFVSAGFGVVALAAAVFVQTGYDDASAIFGAFVPLVVPASGLGVWFAVASVVAQAAGLRARVRGAVRV